MPLDTSIPADELAEQLYGATSELLAMSYAPVFAQMLPLIRLSIEHNFDNESNPEGTPWPPRKFRRGDDGHPLLVDTGTLAAAAIGQGTGSIEQLGQHELLVGIDGSVIEYAAAQNYGYDLANIPQREYFGIDELTIDQCEELLADFVMETIFGEDSDEANTSSRSAA